MKIANINQVFDEFISIDKKNIVKYNINIWKKTEAFQSNKKSYLVLEDEDATVAFSLKIEEKEEIYILNPVTEEPMPEYEIIFDSYTKEIKKRCRNTKIVVGGEINIKHSNFKSRDLYYYSNSTKKNKVVRLAFARKGNNIYFLTFAWDENLDVVEEYGLPVKYLSLIKGMSFPLNNAFGTGIPFVLKK